MKELFLSWGLLVISVIFNALGVFVLKFKLNEFGAIPVNSIKSFFDYCILLIKSPLVVGGGILFFLSPFIFAVALSRMEITVAYPAQIGLNFLFLLVVSIIFLGEGLTVYKLIGIMLVLVASFFLTEVDCTWYL